jgi:MFS transporter, DHA1 family, multidrug resistance protein
MREMQSEKQPNTMATTQIVSHSLPADDPDNPMNWPLHRKLYASAVAWFFSFAV